MNEERTPIALIAAVKSVTLSVPGMYCAVCPLTVKKALAQVKGVERVEVDYDKKEATVVFDDAKARLADLTRATKAAGYPSKPVGPARGELPMSGGIVLESTLTCPHCGHRKTERMPTDACQWFYECETCHQVPRPKPGDCCVFCSYGTLPCPPIQASRDGGCQCGGHN